MGIDMSKELEALEELFGIAAYCNCNLDGMDETQLEKYDKKCENIKKIIEQALKRNEPMKVKEKQKVFCGLSIILNGICPKCHHQIHNNQKYCDNCGKALDWTK